MTNHLLWKGQPFPAVAKLIPFILMLAVLTLIFPPVFAQEELKAGAQYTLNSYRIGPGDILTVHVYHQPDLSQQDILVRDDGQATFNMVGEMAVAGKNLDEITQALKVQLSEYFLNPMVTVTVSQTKPGVVYVAGAVKRPGMIQVQSSPAKTAMQTQADMSRMGLHLSNILANAGGVQMNADLSHVQITQGATQQVTQINLWQMLKAGKSDSDLLVQSGDSIYVPALPAGAMTSEEYQLVLRSSIGPGTFPVRVIGHVEKPGVYELSGTSPYLNSAIAMAGGWKISANKQLIAIRRFPAHDKATTLFVDPNQADTLLQPNDVIFISERGIYKAGRFFETVARILAPFTSIANTYLWASNLSGR